MKLNDFFKFCWDSPYKDSVKYDASYAVYNKDDTLIVAFQQTDSKKDWVQNLKITPVETDLFGPQIKIHKGFLQQFEEIKDSVKDELDTQLKNKNYKKVIFFGWSQGAVLCSLFYRWYTFTLKREIKIEVKGYIFGCPKFIKGKKWNCTEFVEVRNKNDLITKIPFFFKKPKYSTIKFGEFFNIIKIFNVPKYHTSYIECQGIDLEI